MLPAKSEPSSSYLASLPPPRLTCPQASFMILSDYRSFVLMKVLFAVLKKDIEVARIDCSNSI